MEKLIIYELNEIPKRLLIDYISQKPCSTLAHIFKNGLFKETLTLDHGELHPWTTWPTFYRGVDNSKHGIQFINQDKSYADLYFPSVWDILLRKNISIGIFGSLQSFPPPKSNKHIKFYLPDTFAPNEKSIPKKLESFQKFNLSVVSNNNAISRNINFIEIKNFFNCFLNNLISLNSLFHIISHLIKELFLKKYKQRRALLQPILGFDTYIKYLKKEKPSFSTFFTNHLAGMMHRYWYDYFPKDFKVIPRIKSKFKRNSILKALDIADNQLKILLDFADNNNYNIWIASSMGQDYIKRKKYIKELFLKKPKNLLKIMKLDASKYTFLPSMYPDINIDCSDSESTKVITEATKYLVDSGNQQIFKLRYKPNKNKINLTINSSEKLILDKFLFFKKRKYSINKLGLEIFKRDQGTGYHIPEGILLAYGSKSESLLKKFKTIDTKFFAPLILSFFKIKKMEYMQDI